MNRKTMILIVGVITISAVAALACRSSLADRISLNLIQIKAKQLGEYCYATDNNDNFCLKYYINK